MGVEKAKSYLKVNSLAAKFLRWPKLGPSIKGTASAGIATTRKAGLYFLLTAVPQSMKF